MLEPKREYPFLFTFVGKAGEGLLDMGKAYRAGDFEVKVGQGEVLGFAFPTHRWSTPPLVDEFVRRARFAAPNGETFKPAYCFTVETYGHFPGTESRFFAGLLKKHQGIDVDSAFAEMLMRSSRR